MFRVFLLSIFVFSLSLPVYAEDHYVESHSLQCAKWLLGNDWSTFESRQAAARACANGATVGCAQWVLGSEWNNYNNRLKSVEACNPKCSHHEHGLFFADPE